ncbi:hypothetical protein ACXET9_03985 [Brachybacterium sp. DNPG3]
MLEEPAPCSAWSTHAAELAEPVVRALVSWPEGPGAESLVHEGLAVRLRPGLYVPPDVLAGGAVPRILAVGAALGTWLRPHHVVTGITAAWVRLGGHPPASIEIVSTTHRGALAGTMLRNSRLRPHEVETLAGAPLTVPARTCFDLLRFDPSPARTAAAAGLIAAGHVTAEEAEQALASMRRHPAAPAVRLRLAEAAALAAALAVDDPWVCVFPRPRVISRRAQLAGVRGAPEPTGFPSAVTR